MEKEEVIKGDLVPRLRPMTLMRFPTTPTGMEISK